MKRLQNTPDLLVAVHPFEQGRCECGLRSCLCPRQRGPPFEESVRFGSWQLAQYIGNWRLTSQSGIWCWNLALAFISIRRCSLSHSLTQQQQQHQWKVDGSAKKEASAKQTNSGLFHSTEVGTDGEIAIEMAR